MAKGDAALEGAGGTYVFFDFTKAALKRLFKGKAVKATLEAARARRRGQRDVGDQDGAASEVAGSSAP